MLRHEGYYALQPQGMNASTKPNSDLETPFNY